MKDLIKKYKKEISDLIIRSKNLRASKEYHSNVEINASRYTAMNVEIGILKRVVSDLEKIK